MIFSKRLAEGDDIDAYDILFYIGMWWRILYGFLRIGLSLVLFRLVGSPLADVFYGLLKHELVEDQSDLLVRITGSFFGHFHFTVTYFTIAYLVFWGVVDIILSASLLKRKLWAFPVSICLIGIFVLYEIYRFSHTHSLVLLGLIFFDIFLIWLIAKEYRRQEARIKKIAQSS